MCRSCWSFIQIIYSKCWREEPNVDVNVDVNRKMLKFVKNPHPEYVKELEKQKEQQTSGEKKAEQRKITNELNKVNEAKQKFTEEHKQRTA